MSRRPLSCLLSLLLGCLAATFPAEATAQYASESEAEVYAGPGELPQSRELDRLLQSAEKQGKLDDLAVQARKTIQDRPNWIAGKMALVLIEVRRGKPEEAKALLEELLSDKNRRVPAIMVMIAGPKLASVPSLRPGVIRLYEQATNPDEIIQYRGSPARALVSLYCADNRKEDARKFLVNFADRRLPQNVIGDNLAVIQMQDRLEIARELERIGYPLDALLLYRKMAEPAKPGGAVARYRPNYQRQLQSEIQRLEKKLPPEAVLAMLPEPSKLQAPAAREVTRPVIEFLIQARREPSGEAALVSPIAIALAATATKPELRQQASDRLASLAAARPDDFSIAVAAALLELASGTAEQQAKAVANVVTLSERRPLASVEASGQLTDLQRAEAAEQFPVCLLVPACVKSEPLKAQGEKLAARALDAASRMPDRSLTSVVLARIGPAAFAQKDPKAFREELLRILQSHLTESGAKLATASINTVSRESFDQIADLALCATDAGLSDVSAECIRRALQAGPPCERSRPGEIAVAVPGMVFDAAARPSSATLGQVNQVIDRLDQRWKEKGLAPAVAYETLAAVVLPESRPTGVWLYAAQPAANRRSVGELLVQRAAEAGKLDDLQKRLSALKPDPDNTLHCLLLKLQIALAGNDTAAAQEILKQMAAQLQQQGTMDIARMLVPAAISALHHSSTRPAAEELVKQISTKLTGGRAWGDRMIQQNPIESTPGK